jgi:HEAT repeat protein
LFPDDRTLDLRLWQMEAERMLLDSRRMALESGLSGLRLELGAGLPALAPMPGMPPMPPMAMAPMMAQADPEAARAQAARAREQADRVREMARAAARDGEDGGSRYYRAGQRALDERQYAKALEYFNRAVEAKGARTDGALYWKAYTLLKMGRRDEGLAALAELEKSYPKSGWLNDARALGVELRQASGQGVSPEQESNEDIKLFAINSLMHTDPERAIPLLEKIVTDPKSAPKLKERALFVVAQGRTPKSSEILVRLAKSAPNPDLQLRAVEYLGTFAAPENRQVLLDVYNSSTDPMVKRSVLRGLMMGKDTEKLLQVARSEKDEGLRREAVQYLGIAKGTNELAQLYASESSPEVKESILRGLMLSRSTDKLTELAKNEKDVRLRRAAIQNLSMHRDPKTADLLVSLYQADSDRVTKAEILNGLFMQKAAKQLVDVVRAEKDPGLRKEGIQRLSMMKSKEATDYLMELLEK